MNDKEFLRRAKEYVDTLMADGFFYDEARALFDRFEQARQKAIKDRRRSFRVVAGGGAMTAIGGGSLPRVRPGRNLLTEASN